MFLFEVRKFGSSISVMFILSVVELIIIVRSRLFILLRCSVLVLLVVMMCWCRLSCCEIVRLSSEVRVMMLRLLILIVIMISICLKFD